MANDLNFYYTDNGTNLPLDINNGNLYFVLTEDKDIASLFLDIEDKRYEIKPIIEEATIEKAGLLSKDDKKKLTHLVVESVENPRTVEIGVNSQEADKRINFSDYVYIKNNKVLTTNSIQKVKVHPIDEWNEDGENEASASVVETQNGESYLDLTLPIPRGQQGPQGLQGKSATIGTVTASLNSEYGVLELPDDEVSLDQSVEVETVDEEDNKTGFIFKFPVVRGKKGDKGDPGDKGETGEQGIQGKSASVDFHFRNADNANGSVEKITDTDENNNIVSYKYIIDIPRGEKGAPGRPFRVDHVFETYQDIIDELNSEDCKIKYGDFILLQNSSNTKEVGYLYYLSYNKHVSQTINGELFENNYGLVWITDMSPTQPTFGIGEETITLNSDKNAEVSIDNSDIINPKINFKIPRGKPLKLDNVTATVDTNFSEDGPTVEANVSSQQDVVNDRENTTIDFNFKNLAAPIVADATVDNLSGTPSVSVDKTVIKDPEDSEKNIQKFTFHFSGLKGEEGDEGTAADTFSEDLISADYSSDTNLNEGLPYAYVKAYKSENQSNKLGLQFIFANLKGENGNLGAIEIAGDGNAITNIENSEDNGIKVTKGNTFITSSDFNSYVNNISWLVNKGGTGRNSFTLNAVLIGNGTNPIEEVQSKTGAFYSDGTNNEPRFGTLPVDKGGTGVTGFKPNSLLVSGPPDVVGGNTSTEINTLYNENGVLIRDNGSIGFSNTLPVEYGGLGIDETVPYTVMTVNGAGDISFESQLSVDKGGTGRDYFEPCLLAGAGLDPITYIKSQVGALYFSGESNNYPEFGILPVELGGTGATNFQDALTNFGALHGEIWEIEDDDYCLSIDGVFS